MINQNNAASGRANAANRGDPNKKIFIGGVPKSVIDDEFREYFASFGFLDDCILMRDQDGICRGFGFVTYRDESSYQQVMEAQLQLRGRPLEQKKAVPRANLNNQKTKIKIFVGGLSPEVDNSILSEHFSQYGEIVDSIVMMDAETGNSRGFGFVTFSDPASVEELLKVPRFDLCGKTVECKRARPLSMTTSVRGMGGGGRSFRGGGSSRGFGGRFGGGANIRDGSRGFDPRYDVDTRFARDGDRYGIIGGSDRYSGRGRDVRGYENVGGYPDPIGYRREPPRYEEKPRYDEPYIARQPIRDPWMDRPVNPVAVQPERNYGDIYEYKTVGSANRFLPY